MVAASIPRVTAPRHQPTIRETCEAWRSMEGSEFVRTADNACRGAA